MPGWRRGRLTVVGVDEVRRLRGVVDELDLADLPHLRALVSELLRHAERERNRRVRRPISPKLSLLGSRPLAEIGMTGIYSGGD